MTIPYHQDLDPTSTPDSVYVDLLAALLHDGTRLTTRNSKVSRLFVVPIHFEIAPLISIRKTAWKSALREMEWFLSGSNDLEDLHPSVRAWWEPWANDQDCVVNNYSVMFRQAGHLRACDPIEYLIAGTRDHPFSRRNLITTWDTERMTHKNTLITNCHGTVIHTFVQPDNSLHLVTYQRSVDTVCGLPHNWIQYWALLLWLAHRTNKTVGSFTWIGGDVHLYQEHEDLALSMIELHKFSPPPSPPNLVYTPTSEEFLASDFSLDGPYNPVLTSPAKMIV